MENSVNFALDTVIQHKGTYYRGTYTIRGTMGICGKYLVHTYTSSLPRLEARSTRFVSRDEEERRRRRLE